MSVSVPFNGSIYLIPTSGETGWGSQVSNFLSDVGNNAVSLTGSQTVTNKVLQSSVGTAGSPSISFTGDTDTGIFHPAANQVAVATNGVQVITVNASGNLILQTGGLISSTHEFVISTDDAHDIVFKPNSSEALRVASGGAVTIQSVPSSTDNSTRVASTSFVQSVLSATPNLNIGRNKFHNGLFNIQQRGVGSWTTNGNYTADRWQMFLVLDTLTLSIGALSDADRTAIGSEDLSYYLNVNVTGNAGASAQSEFQQKVENVRRLANKTITVSFYAKASSGTPKVGVAFQQYFGTGGSPSATVNTNGSSVTLSTTWTRYSVTLSVPSISGKTVGTNSDHYTGILFGVSSGATNSTFYGGLGVQTAIFQFAGMQCEVGSTATPLEMVDVGIDLLQCQRYYQVSQMFAIGYNAAGGQAYGTYLLPTTMRVNPTAAISNQSYANASAFAMYNTQSNVVVCQTTVTATGQASGAATVALTADL